MRRRLLGLLAGLWLGCNGDLAHPDASPDAASPDAASDRAPAVNRMCGMTGVPIEAACSAYCSNVTRYCQGPNAQWPTPDDCEAACNQPRWSCGTPGDQSGDTVFCRDTYALAAQTDPATNCPHAGPDSGTCR